MEVFGLIFSVPFLFVVSSLYVVIIKFAFSKRPIIQRLILFPSLLILLLFFLEFVLVVTEGPLKLNNLLNGKYYAVHIVLFFLNVPALANVLQSQKLPSWLARWYFQAGFCSVWGLGAILLQYSVSETLFGF